MKNFTKINEIIIAAGQISLKYFNQNQPQQCSSKKDDSPVTQADLEVNEYLNKTLRQSFPEVAIISEENHIEENLKSIAAQKVFIIDPLDGTSAFIKGSAEYTINIALKVNSELVFGAIYIPVEDILYYAYENKLHKLCNASLQQSKPELILSSNKVNKNKLTVIATRREDELQEIKKKLRNYPHQLCFVNISSAAKFCYLSEGKADIYYRMARIKLWDVAAGFAIAKAAGLRVIDHSKRDLLPIIFNQNYYEHLSANQFRVEEFIIGKSEIIEELV